MIFDRFRRSYEIQTTKSVNSILRTIEERTQRQQHNKLLFAIEPINYKKLSISEDSIVIERISTLYNPFKGTGTITFKLTPDYTGTSIKCLVNPYQLGMIINLGLVLLFLIIVTFSIFSSVHEFYLSTVIFMLIVWIIPFVCIYFSFYLNTVSLESYSKTILYDLGLMTHDN
jgi:hypothetical protein